MKLLKFLFLIFLIQFINCKANPNNLIVINDYCEGVERGGNSDRPIFIYFTCYGCMGFDEFHENFIRSKTIQEQLNNEFTTVVLYIDSPQKISQSKREKLRKFKFHKEIDIENIETEGQLNKRIQEIIFQADYQPMYVAVNARQHQLINPFGFTNNNEEKFIEELNDAWRDYYQ